MPTPKVLKERRRTALRKSPTLTERGSLTRNTRETVQSPRLALCSCFQGTSSDDIKEAEAGDKRKNAASEKKSPPPKKAKKDEEKTSKQSSEKNDSSKKDEEDEEDKEGADDKETDGKKEDSSGKHRHLR